MANKWFATVVVAQRRAKRHLPKSVYGALVAGDNVAAFNGWRATPAASLARFAGHPAYGLPQLRQDLERFVFLLGGSDGEPLFGA